MSRIASKPILLRKGVECSVVGNAVHVKGKHGLLIQPLHEAVKIEISADGVRVSAKNKPHAMVGTVFKLLNFFMTKGTINPQRLIIRFHDTVQFLIAYILGQNLEVFVFYTF